MNAQEEVLADRLEFFKSAILKRALLYHHLSQIEELGRATSEFGAVEAAHWARLGVQIGYLDAKQAQELFSSSGPVLEAWAYLRNRQIISPEDDWASIIRTDDRGRTTLNEESFSFNKEMHLSTRELLQNTFQTFLLLTSESILDDEAHYFLQSIAWTPAAEWNARKMGMVYWWPNSAFRTRLANQWPGSAQGIGAGFADVLNYWEEMESASRDVVRQHDSLSLLSLPADPAGDLAAVSSFLDDVRKILIPRFRLSHGQTVARYFSFAGELVRRVADDSLECLDARRKIFDNLQL